jgi:hypothetical protein
MRMAVCDPCELNSKFHKGFRPDEHCMECGCTISAKTACLSCACPLDKWKEVMTSEQEEEIKETDEQDGRNKEDSFGSIH